MMKRPYAVLYRRRGQFEYNTSIGMGRIQQKQQPNIGEHRRTTASSLSFFFIHFFFLIFVLTFLRRTICGGRNIRGGRHSLLLFVFLFQYCSAVDLSDNILLCVSYCLSLHIILGLCRYFTKKKQKFRLSLAFIDRFRFFLSRGRLLYEDDKSVTINVYRIMNHGLFQHLMSIHSGVLRSWHAVGRSVCSGLKYLVDIAI